MITTDNFQKREKRIKLDKNVHNLFLGTRSTVFHPSRFCELAHHIHHPTQKQRERKAGIMITTDNFYKREKDNIIFTRENDNGIFTREKDNSIFQKLQSTVFSPLTGPSTFHIRNKGGEEGMNYYHNRRFSEEKKKITRKEFFSSYLFFHQGNKMIYFTTCCTTIQP